MSRITARERSSISTASAGISHIIASGQEPLKLSSYWSPRRSRRYSGMRKSSSQAMNSGPNIQRLP